METVHQGVEVRYQAAVYNLTATAEGNHRSEVAQRVGEANRAFEELANGHAAATEKLQQEAIASREEFESYSSAKQSAESQEARAVIADISRADSLREEEVRRLLAALQTAQTAIAQSQAEQVSKIAHAYATGVQHAAREARLSPPRSHATSSPTSVRCLGLSPGMGQC